MLVSILVIPAKAGIQDLLWGQPFWIPAFAGMTLSGPDPRSALVWPTTYD